MLQPRGHGRAHVYDATSVLPHGSISVLGLKGNHYQLQQHAGVCKLSRGMLQHSVLLCIAN